MQSKILLEKLNRRQNEIRESEKAFVAREVHDEFGQSMAALKLGLSRMYRYVLDRDEASELLDKMISIVTDSISMIQRISSDLRPGMLDDLGLATTMEWYCDEFEKRTGIRCILELNNTEHIDPRISLTFYRVLEETLNNVLRHSRASEVLIELHSSAKGTIMRIRDNGIGMQEDKLDPGKSLGLVNIREIVRQLNGKTIISSKNGHGTRLTIIIP